MMKQARQGKPNKQNTRRSYHVEGEERQEEVWPEECEIDEKTGGEGETDGEIAGGEGFDTNRAVMNSALHKEETNFSSSRMTPDL
ncbi:unnamed protein product [Arctogadus glacialis]